MGRDVISWFRDSQINKNTNTKPRTFSMSMMNQFLLLLGTAASAAAANPALVVQIGGTVFKIEAWGDHSLRVRASTSG
jgi:hypothetical protein